MVRALPDLLAGLLRRPRQPRSARSVALAAGICARLRLPGEAAVVPDVADFLREALRIALSSCGWAVKGAPEGYRFRSIGTV